MKRDLVKSKNMEAGQSLTEFVVVLPLFLILTFAGLGLARLVYVRWELEERSRFLAFSAAHGIDAEALFDKHLASRPRSPNYMRGVSFRGNRSSFGDLISLIDSSDIKDSSSDDPIPRAVLSPVQPAGSAARGSGGNVFWTTVFKGEQHARRVLSDSTVHLNRVGASEIRAIDKINPYVGTRSAMRMFERKLQLTRIESTSSPDQISELDVNFQSDMLDSAVNPRSFNTVDNFTLTRLHSPRRSYVGAFQGVMRNVLSADTEQISSAIDNSVYQTSYSVDGIGSVLQTLPLHGLANSALNSNLYLVTDSWDIDRQSGTKWRNLGNSESTYSDSDEEGILRRRTMGLWMFPSNPGALLEPMTALFPRQLRSVVSAVNGPISRGITLIKELLSDNPLNRVLRAVQRLPIIGSIFDIELPEWPAVRPEAYPGSKEMHKDRLTGRKRDFKDYVREQEIFHGRGR